jgi:hypothetical protein
MKTSITVTIASLNSLIFGIKKYQPKVVFAVSGKKYTAAQVTTIIESIVEALQAVGPARGTYLRASRSADALLAQNGTFLQGLKSVIQTAEGDNPATLADYGLTPRKLGGKTTPAIKAAAAEQAKATRVARHTMGKKQKAKITGASAAASVAQSSAPMTTAPTSAAPTANPAETAPTAVSGNPALQTAVTPGISGH